MQYKMKYTSYLAALSVLFATACAKEEITEYTAPAMPEDAVRFSGSVERLAGTRTSYEDTEESVTVQWADKDRIGVFCVADGVSVAANYGYQNTAAGQNAVFTAISSDMIISKAPGSHSFYAYYPYTEGNIADAGAVPVTLPAEQKFDPVHPQGEFAALDFMYAKAEDIQFTGEEYESQMIDLKFSHLFSILEIRLSADRPAIVDELIFSCDDDTETVSLGEGSTVDIRTGTVIPAAGTSTSGITLSGSQMIQPCSVSIWQMFITPGHAGKTFTVKAVINGNEYTVAEGKAAPEGGFLAGDTYYMTYAGLEVNPDDAATVDLSADGTANTYIVSYPATTYTFDATVKGNGIERSFTWSESDGTQITRSYTAPDLEIAPASVGLVWYNTPKTADGYVNESPVVIGSVSYDPETGMASFTTPAEYVTGNALLAAYDSEGTILWSWNIWAAGNCYNADSASRPAANGYVMMDRNLGASAGPEVRGTPEEAWAIGNYYQWGRKDPFPAAAEYVAVSGVTGGDRSWGLPTHTPVEALRQAADKQTLGFSDLIFGTDAVSNCHQLSSALGNTFTVDQAVEESVRYPYRWMCWSGSDSAKDDYNWTRSDLSGTENARVWKYLWGNPDKDPQGEASDNVKTVYDPCPPGWKVMPRAAWSFSDLNDVSGWHGYYSASMDIYVPDSGQRQAGFGGSLIGSIDNGTAFISIANVSENVPYRTDYGATTSFNAYLGSGWNVRCVKE